MLHHRFLVIEVVVDDRTAHQYAGHVNRKCSLRWSLPEAVKQSVDQRRTYVHLGSVPIDLHKAFLVSFDLPKLFDKPVVNVSRRLLLGCVHRLHRLHWSAQPERWDGLPLAKAYLYVPSQPAAQYSCILLGASD
jgi:hypothetical protein